MYLMRQLGWNRGSLYSSRPLQYARWRELFYWTNLSRFLFKIEVCPFKLKRKIQKLIHKQSIKEVFR